MADSGNVELCNGWFGGALAVIELAKGAANDILVPLS